MPNPKRRHSNRRTRTRRATYQLKAGAINYCAKCGGAVRTHRVCDNCGYYGFAKGADKQGTEVFAKQDF